MTRRLLSFALLAGVAAVVFVRLGLWQLDRLAERRAQNRLVAERIRLAPVPIDSILDDTTATRFRRVTAAGRYDAGRELVLASRTNAGSPGVHLITPLRLPGRDTAVLVNRGWVYSPDGATVDAGRWREPADARLEGFIEETFAVAGGAVSSPRDPRLVRRLARDSLASRFPYPIARHIVVATTPATGPRDSIPVRLSPPPLDEGPHRGYAVQWFSFALIAVVGAGLVAARERHARRAIPGPGVTRRE